MVQWHMKSSVKVSGGKKNSLNRSDKRLAWRGGEFANATISPDAENVAVEVHKTLGNTEKTKVKFAKYVHTAEKPGKKSKKLEILSVVDNEADAQLARRNIITKGAVLKAKDGSNEVFVKVTSRPGQAGSINGIILENYTPMAQAKKAESVEKKKRAAKKAASKKSAKKGEDESKKAPKSEK